MSGRKGAERGGPIPRIESMTVSRDPPRSGWGIARPNALLRRYSLSCQRIGGGGRRGGTGLARGLTDRRPPPPRQHHHHRRRRSYQQQQPPPQLLRKLSLARALFLFPPAAGCPPTHNHRPLAFSSRGVRPLARAEAANYTKHNSIERDRGGGRER